MSGPLLEQRLEQVFGAVGEPVIIPKGLVAELPALGRVPRYVAEFLLARHPRPREALSEVADYLRRHHPAPSERGLWMHRLVQEGRVALVDLAEVRIDPRTGLYWASVQGLRLGAVRVEPDLAGRFPGLLAGGLWGHISLVWEAGFEIDGEPRPIFLEKFQPVQLTVRLDRLIEGRHYFSARQWLDVILISCGYDPKAIGEGCVPELQLRRKLLMITRLAPLVEPNLNLLEFGPKNTGKTYLLRNVSSRAFVLSGGKATPASLFVNLVTGAPGLLADRKVVVFDEVARVTLGSAEALATLKDFLESGSFSRGRQELQSECSVVFSGNIEVEGGRPARRYRHLLEPLPFELRDSAFVDRIHGYLPGWELPKLTPSSFSKGLGFVSDYFGEAMVALRAHSFEQSFHELTCTRPLLDGMTRRDAVAVERIARALLKILFPHGQASGEGDVVDAVLDLAGELRQRVHDQLCVMAPGEFSPRRIGYRKRPPSAEGSGVCGD